MHRELHGNIHVSDTSYGRYIDIQMPRKGVHTTLFQESKTKRWFIVSQEFAQRAGLVLDTPEIQPLGFLVIPEPIGSIQDKRIIVHTSETIQNTVEQLLNGDITVGDESDLIQLNPGIGFNTIDTPDHPMSGRMQQEFSIPE